MDTPSDMTTPAIQRPHQTDLLSLPVGLLSNPLSGRNRTQLQSIRGIVANQPGIHHRVTQSSGDVPAALSELADKSVGILAINGGDGTVARVLGCLLEDAPFDPLPIVVLLPGGTTNMDVGDVGLRGSLQDSAARLCRWAGSRDGRHQLLQRPLLRVVPGDGQPAVYGMFFGAGAIIQGIEYCRASLHTKGVANALGQGLTLVRSLWGIVQGDPRFAQPVTVSVTLDNGTPGPPEAQLLLLVSSLERLSLGIRPYWGREDGPLHVSLVRQGAGHFLRNLPALLRGKPGRHTTVAAGYRSHNADRVDLEMDATWTLDGELHRAQRRSGPVAISASAPLTFLRI